MKFGKELLLRIVQSNPQWAPFWLSYNILKKRIKTATSTAHRATKQQNIAESKVEVAFFRDLQVELKKISLFYVAEEKRCFLRYQKLHSMLKSHRKERNIEASKLQRLLFAFVHFYHKCIRLESFAVMNYQGFSKILKKHDKMTGYNTRSRYMLRKVNLSPFSSYQNLLKILSNTEKMFFEVDRNVRMAATMPAQKLKIRAQATNDPGMLSTVKPTPPLPSKFLFSSVTPSIVAASFHASTLKSS
ncbi:uncharacterized protein CCR75_002146 [Bremia lactucae]|uniref:SPX domain-containing protein n=1 Tax=Bremia lactucae TaxID=4779 RepID=A0A976FE17_BRELC|nr:hypothetical protein CCR75_002146 [Bremia lactucae]